MKKGNAEAVTLPMPGSIWQRRYDLRQMEVMTLTEGYVVARARKEPGRASLPIVVHSTLWVEEFDLLAVTPCISPHAEEVVPIPQSMVDDCARSLMAAQGADVDHDPNAFYVAQAEVVAVLEASGVGALRSLAAGVLRELMQLRTYAGLPSTVAPASRAGQLTLELQKWSQE